jgi:3-oxoacyl-[acyl-carrier protein] reductase
MKAAEIFDLTGETALVTGASSGFGARFARVLAANGAKVVLVARRPEPLAANLAAIRACGGTAVSVSADVTTEEGIADAFDEAERAFGTVTVLINNAGTAHASKLVDETREGWSRVMALNLDAVLFCGQEAARRMIAAGKGGSIVNIASVLGLRSQKAVAAYCTSKAGVLHLTRGMAMELAGRDIRVNALAPGYAVTELNRDYLTSAAGQTMIPDIPMRRFGEDGDLDGPLLLLASKAGRWMTGSSVVVDGGHIIPL